METLLKYPNQDASNLIVEVMGYKIQHQTWQMKHDIAMEYHAKKHYEKLLKNKHQNLSTKDCGIKVLKSHPWISVNLRVRPNFFN